MQVPTASLSTTHDRFVVQKGAQPPLNTTIEDALLTEALNIEPNYIEAPTDTGSDAESENEYERGARFARRVAEDELAYRPRNGYGQRPWAITNRARFHKTMYNVTIGFALHMRNQGHDIQALPLQQRLIIKELLEADRKLKEKEANEAAQVAAANLPKVRPGAEEAFPGVISLKKRRLHWGIKESSVGMKNHFNGLQFRRALYEDGVDDIEGLEAMKTTALVGMWMQRRDELHSGRGTSHQEAEYVASSSLVEGTENVLEASTAEEPAHGPISMAAMFSSQVPDASHEATNTRLVPETSAPVSGLGKDSIPTADTEVSPTLTTTQAFGQIGVNLIPTTTTLLSTDTAGLAQAIPTKESRVHRKNSDSNREKVRREALAIRVGRYPLSLPGNNKGQPLSMNLNISAFTIKQKYNVSMTTQLLKDYNVLPTDPEDLKPHEKLAERLVREREKLMKSGAKLQEPWTHQLLEAFVAAQEANGHISPATPVSGAGPANTQISPSPSAQESESMAGVEKATIHASSTSGTSTTKKRRNREDDDLQSGRMQPLSRKRPRKIAKIEKSAHETSQRPALTSAYMATEHHTAFQLRPVADETKHGTLPVSSAYAYPALNIPQEETSLINWDQQLQQFQSGAEQPPQWSNTGRLDDEQQSTYPAYSTSDYASQSDYPVPSQVATSAYTMHSATVLTSDTTFPIAPDLPIDPALLYL